MPSIQEIITEERKEKAQEIVREIAPVITAIILIPVLLNFSPLLPFSFEAYPNDECVDDGVTIVSGDYLPETRVTLLRTACANKKETGNLMEILEQRITDRLTGGYPPDIETDPWPPEHEPPQVEMNAMYYPENETMTVEMTEGELNRSNTQTVWIGTNYKRMLHLEAERELENGLWISKEGEGTWESKEGRGVADFPLEPGDKVTITGDGRDMDGDRKSGLEGYLYINIYYDEPENGEDKARYTDHPLAAFEIINETAQKVGRW